MKKILSLFLVFVMMFSFVACSGGDDSSKGTKPGDTTASNDPDNNGIEYEKDDLPDDLNFGGQVVRFLLEKRSATEGKASSDKDDVFTEELNSDVVNDSIYNREKYVEERIGVELEPVYIDPRNGGDYEKTVEKQIAADEDEYQLLGYITFAFTRFVFMDYLNDLYELNYLDLEKPWWSQTFNAEAEVMDGLYVTTGSLSLSLTRALFAIFYNKSLAESNSEKYPELLDLYNVVENGDWTFDKMCELGSTIYIDNNGSTTADSEDTFGLGFQKGIGIDFIWSSFDISVLSPDEDGWFELDVPTEKLYSALDMLTNLLYNTTGCFVAGYDDDNLDILSAMFASNNLLFMNNSLEAIESTTLRNMQSDYGILPTPKYDEKQNEYYSYAHDSYISFAIPKTNRNPDTAAAVLEAMASYAYRDTEPAYLDTALKGKYMSDPQSRKMLDLVVDGFKVDAAWIYLETLSAEYPANFRIMISNNKTNYASQHATMERKVKNALKMFKVTTKFS
ncbi:MAG: hypothetical protein IKT70_07065 [Clostridia bacterium]|nr:hypothetical protein [Clostridia bacterium]